MRTAVDEKDDQKSLKQKTKERVRPKLGKLTIDYQKLHDAFFKWQTKPHMTIHGDLYYEVGTVEANQAIHVHDCVCINTQYTCTTVLNMYVYCTCKIAVLL